MTDKQKETILAVLRTLDTIPVSGAQNMDRMLGCIQVLRSLTAEAAEEQKGA